MKNLAVVLVATAGLTACDAWFHRRIDITEKTTDTFAVGAPSTSRLAALVRSYGEGIGLSCSEPDALPIECWKQPVRVWAVATDRGAIVCYNAMGALFECSKNETHMTRLQETIAQEYGASSVSVPAERCPAPPSFGRGEAQLRVQPGGPASGGSAG